jgi:hypothetical protein
VLEHRYAGVDDVDDVYSSHDVDECRSDDAMVVCRSSIVYSLPTVLTHLNEKVRPGKEMNNKVTIFKGYSEALSRHLREVLEYVVQYYNEQYNIESNVDELMGILRAPLPPGKQFGTGSTQRSRKPSTAVEHFQPGVTCCYKFTKGEDKYKYCGKPVVLGSDKCKACLKKGSKKEPGEKKKKDLFRTEETDYKGALVLKKLPGTNLLIHEASNFVTKEGSDFVLAGRYINGKLETNLSADEIQEALDLEFVLDPNGAEPTLAGKKVPELPSTPDRNGMLANDALPRPRTLIPRTPGGGRLPNRNRPLEEVVGQPSNDE